MRSFLHRFFAAGTRHARLPHVPCLWSNFDTREAQSRFQEKEQDLSNRIDALQQEQRRLEDRSVMPPA